MKKFLGLFQKKAAPKESVPVEDDMPALETQLRTKVEKLMQTIHNMHSNDGSLTNKQIINLIVAIDPIIADLGKLLNKLNPAKDTETIGEARLAYEENSYLRDVLLSKVKEFH